MTTPPSPERCPICHAPACGHICNCGSVNHPATEGRLFTPFDGQHRYCCNCEACYAEPERVGDV